MNLKIVGSRLPVVGLIICLAVIALLLIKGVGLKENNQVLQKLLEKERADNRLKLEKLTAQVDSLQIVVNETDNEIVQQIQEVALIPVKYDTIRDSLLHLPFDRKVQQLSDSLSAYRGKGRYHYNFNGLTD